MSHECVCDDGERADVYASSRQRARRSYRCYEYSRQIKPGENYERAAALYDGKWTVARTCFRCLDARDYITAHAPCFCWRHGSMLDDAQYVVDSHGRESAGFYIGATKRILRAQRHA